MEAAIADVQRQAAQNGNPQSAEIRGAVMSLVERLDVLTRRLDVIAEQARASRVVANQMMELAIADREWRSDVGTVQALMSKLDVAPHVTQAIQAATLEGSPLPHVVIPNVLPQEVYKALLTFLPPRAFFEGLENRSDKNEVGLPMRYGPEASLVAWNFMYDLTHSVVIPALARRFEPAMRDYMQTTFPGQIGKDTPIIDDITFVKETRIFRRGPGYTLKPHRDPQWGFVTSLFYLARPKDRPEHGTQLYAVDEDQIATTEGVYYPDESHCRAVKTVPFTPNTALAFLDSAGAHGASVPPDADPSTERYLYSIRFGPNSRTRERLMASSGQAAYAR